MKIFNDEERKSSYKNETPFHYVAMNNAKEMGELLISKGENLNVKDNHYQNKLIFFFINMNENE